MIAIACDHAAVQFKEEIKTHLDARGIPYKDFGSDGKAAADYPDFALPAARAVRDGVCEKGILICGTGIGMSIAANKVKGIRCALCSDTFSARATREHNDANMLALGARVIGTGLALDIVDMFLDTPFSGAERHARRIGKITAIEADECGR